MSDAYNNSLKSKIRHLNKGVKPDSPLFIPQIFAMGAQLEAISYEDFSYNPTKLSRGVSELRNVLNFGVVTPAFSTAMEAEALGAELDWAVYPPVITQRPFADSKMIFNDELVENVRHSKRVAVAIEGARRIKATSGKDTVIAASLVGTATLASQLVGPGISERESALNADLLEYCGRCQAGFVRALTEAGTQVIILHEPDVIYAMGDLREAWLGSLRPIINVAKFHRSLVAVAPVLEDAETMKYLMDENLVGAIWCPPIELVNNSDIKALGVSVSNNPEDWADFPLDCGLVVTRGEVPPEIQIPEMKAALESYMHV